MALKGELVNSALRRAGILGFNSTPNPSYTESGLEVLEDMLAEWDSKNVCVGYFFEENPDPNTESGIVKAYQSAVKTNLAVRLLPEFGREVSQALYGQAQQSYSSLSSAVAVVRKTQYPRNMPTGSGNRLLNRFQKFSRPVEQAPIDCDTKIIPLAASYDYEVKWDEWLSDGDTLTAYTINVTAGLTLVASQLNGDTSVYFKVTGSAVGYQKVSITVTDSDGNTDPRVINFNVIAEQLA